MKTIVFLLISFASVQLAGQINIEEEGMVAQMMSDYISMNQENSQQKAWKIQIITTNDRREMEQAIGKFSQYFPEYQTKWYHENPYYKVKVGAFETKEDLYAFLLMIKQYFPSAIPVVDNINKSELVRS